MIRWGKLLDVLWNALVYGIAAWEPGMNWYADSFAELMVQARNTFLEVRELERNEGAPDHGK